MLCGTSGCPWRHLDPLPGHVTCPMGGQRSRRLGRSLPLHVVVSVLCWLWRTLARLLVMWSRLASHVSSRTGERCHFETRLRFIHYSENVGRSYLLDAIQTAHTTPPSSVATPTRACAAPSVSGAGSSTWTQLHAVPAAYVTSVASSPASLPPVVLATQSGEGGGGVVARQSAPK